MSKSDETTQPKTIHEAAERGMVQFIVRQVERNIEFDINQKDRFQRTALHWAAELNQVEAAETLIDYNIDLLATECNGRTALHLAAKGGHTDVMQVLLEAIENDEAKAEYVNMPDTFGITAVFMALQKGTEGRAAFEFLMMNGAKYNH